MKKILGFLLLLTPLMANAGLLKAISFSKDGNNLELRLVLDKAIKFKSSSSANSIYIDLTDTSVVAKKSGSINIGKAVDYSVFESSGHSRFTVNLKEMTPYVATTAGNTIILTLSNVIERKDGKPAMTDTISLNFQDISVRSVLQVLADEAGMNMVASDSVGGTITLRLDNVPWDQALEIILKSKGLGKRVIGSVMMIGLQDEIAAQEKFELLSKKEVEELSPLETHFIEVNYAKAADMEKLLKSPGGSGADSSGTGLISARGSVSVDLRTNTLLIKETKSRIKEIKAVIKRLDQPVRQVLIEAKIVIANDDFTRDLGVRFGLSGVSASNDAVSLVGGGLAGNVETLLPIFNAGGIGAEGLMVDLPAANPAGAIQFIVGKIGSSLLQLELSALELESKGEIVSSPRVMTSDQKEAVISQGVSIPFQEASSSGATSTSFQEAVLRLRVTPRITPDDKINLDLDISKDSPDFSNIQPGGVPINTQSLQTTVLVSDGETIVLGGIFEQSDSSKIKKIPILGDLPAVGNLFKNRFKQTNKRELLFFITPKIMRTLKIR